MDELNFAENEPLPRFRVDYQPMEQPFTCTLSAVPQRMATATILDSGYVMIDPESRQAVFVVINNDKVTADSE